MLYQEESMAIGPAISFTCRSCGQLRAGHLILRKRRAHYFFVPIANTQTVLAKCDACDAEYFTSDLALESLDDLPAHDLDSYIGRLNSPLFPKLLIAIMMLTILFPLVPLLCYLHARTYRDRIYGRWRKLLRVLFWVAVCTNLLFFIFALIGTLTTP